MKYFCVIGECGLETHRLICPKHNIVQEDEVVASEASPFEKRAEKGKKPAKPKKK